MNWKSSPLDCSWSGASGGFGEWRVPLAQGKGRSQLAWFAPFSGHLLS